MISYAVVSSEMNHSAKKILALCNEAKECPICHVCFKNNVTFASGCLHCYCYQCLSNWVQRRATCPLCRKPVEYIIKNVKSNDDYDIEEVVPPPNDNSDQEGDFEQFGASDQESQRSASTVSVESVSDSSESDVESSIDELSASELESNEEFSIISEHESDGNVSDREIYYETESELDSVDNFTESDHEFDGEMSEHEFDSEMSEAELDSDNMSEHESGEGISSTLPDYSSDSDDELNERDFKFSDDEISSASVISSNASDQDSDEGLLSNEDQNSADDPSSSASNLESDDYFSSSSGY